MKKRKLLENTSTFACVRIEVLKLSKTIDLKKLIDVFIKYSILITLATYLIGTILLFFRNWSEGIPFMPLSITQLAAIDIYFLSIVAAFLICEYWLCELWRLIRNSSCKMSEKIIWRVLSIIIGIAIILGIASVISIFTKDLLATTLLFSISFLILPGYFHLFMTKLSPKVAVTTECSFILCIAYFLVYNIPMNVGGLAPQHIKYCTSTSDTSCENYNYFGNYDGMLILKNEKNIILEPIGQGVIKYKQFDPDSNKKCPQT